MCVMDVHIHFSVYMNRPLIQMEKRILRDSERICVRSASEVGSRRRTGSSTSATGTAVSDLGRCQVCVAEQGQGSCRELTWSAMSRARTSMREPDSEIILAALMTSDVCFSGPLPLQGKYRNWESITATQTRCRTTQLNKVINPYSGDRN